MKPSCAVMKFTLHSGERRSDSYTSGLPVIRWASAPSTFCPLCQKSRTSSRNFPFHSDQSAGKPPTWYPAVSHGSAIIFTGASTGSWWIRVRNALWISASPSWRVSVVARSKRKPSTCISSTQ